MAVEYRGCELPEDLYYDLDYVWARPEDDGSFTIGLTDPAQTMAGRVQYVRFRKPGSHREAGRPVGRLESGKWAGGIPAPFDGTILELNQAVADDPGLVNVAPYTDAWLVRMQPDAPDQAYAKLHTGGQAIEALKAWVDRYDIQCMRCVD